MESLSSYAKRFVAQVAKPDVDFVFGLSPVISIEQKTIAQQSALDRRHHDRHRQLPEPALRDHRPSRTARAPASASPSRTREPDPRSDPVAARRHGDRAARAGVQGLRRRAGLRLHRGPQEGLPPADHRRQAGGHLRRSRRSTKSTVTRHGRRRRSLRRRPQAREGDQGRRSPRRCWSATGCCRSQVVKGAAKAEAERFYKGLCSPTHHFVYGDIEPEYFMFNNPESACRTCGGLGVHKLTHPELLVPDPQAQHPRRLLRARGVQVQPRHLGRPHDVQPLEGAAASRSTRRGRSCPRRCATRSSTASTARRSRSLSPPDAKVKREDWDGQGGRLRRHRAPHRAPLPPLPPARRSQLGDGSVARQGDGRAHLPRLQRRAAPRHAAAVHHRGQDHPRRRPAPLRRAARLPRHASSRPAAAPTRAGRC